MTEMLSKEEAIEQDVVLPSKRQRCGQVALLGQSNVGKSTLLNALIGEKLAICSPKTQTTRQMIRGILTRQNCQSIWLDTPGFLTDKAPLKKMMQQASLIAQDAADVWLWILEAEKNNVASRLSRPLSLSQQERNFAKKAAAQEIPLLIAFNKIDLLKDKKQLLPQVAFLHEICTNAEIFPISASRQQGLEPLLQRIESLLPEQDFLYPEDIFTTHTEKFLCEELLREQILLMVHEEVPHGVCVQIECFDDLRHKQKPLCRIEGSIWLEKESQKSIVIGAKGQKLKAISTEARVALEALLGCQVYLRMVVRLESNWTQKSEAVQRLSSQQDGLR